MERHRFPFISNTYYTTKVYSFLFFFLFIILFIHGTCRIHAFSCSFSLFRYSSCFYVFHLSDLYIDLFLIDMYNIFIILFILIFCNHVLIFDCCIHSKLIPHKDAKGETVMDCQFPIARPNDGPCDLTNLI